MLLCVIKTTKRAIVIADIHTHLTNIKDVDNHMSCNICVCVCVYLCKEMRVNDDDNDKFNDNKCE